MSDVVAVGLITGLVGLAGSFVTYLVARHQGDVELRKVKTEHAEARRAERQQVYREMLTLIRERRYLVDRPSLTAEQATELRTRLNDAESAVGILGSPAVAEAVAAYQEVMLKMGAEAKRLLDESPDATIGERLGRAWKKYESDAIAAERAVVAAMRDDVNVTGART